MFSKLIDIQLIKLFTLIGSFFISLSSYANPAPFGLEVGKSTIKELHHQYHINSVEKYTNFGQIFYVGSSNTQHPEELEGIKKIGFAFDEHGILELVEVIIDKSHFTKINTFLSKKYIHVAQKPAQTHDHYALYKEGDCDIFILSTLQDENLHVVYATKRAHEKYNHLVPHPKVTVQNRG